MDEKLNELDDYCGRYKGLFNIVNTIKELIVKLKRKVTHKVKSNTQKSEVSSLSTYFLFLRDPATSSHSALGVTVGIHVLFLEYNPPSKPSFWNKGSPLVQRR